MRTAALLVVLAGAFELLWARSPVWRARRHHFRAMLALFWTLAFAIWAGDAWGLAPGLYFNSVARFASDAYTYQVQGLYVADGLRNGSIVPLTSQQIFNYSRLVGILLYLSGESRLIASLFNAIFYMISVLSVFTLARRLYGDRPAIVAAWLAACWPIFLLYETQTLRWVTTTAGLHLTLVSIVALVASRRVLYPVLGTFAGFAILLTDMPQFARLCYVVAFGYALILLAADLFGRTLPVRAIRVAIVAVVMASSYHFAWVLPARDSSSVTFASSGNGAGPPAPGPQASPALPDERMPTFDEFPVVQRATYLDRLIAPILETRIGYLRQNQELIQQGIEMGTPISARPLVSSRAFLMNIPDALGAAILTPTPASLMRSGTGASRLGRYAAAEVVVYYGLLLTMGVGIAQALRKGGDSMFATIFILLFTLAAYIVIGTVTMNGGTMHRFRLPYVVLHMAYAAPVFAALIARLKPHALDVRQ